MTRAGVSSRPGAIRIVAGPADDRPQRRFDFRPVGSVIVVLGIRVSSQRFYKCVHRYLPSQCLSFYLLTTVIVPVMSGWTRQKYLIVPVLGHLLPSGLPGSDHDVPIAACCGGRVIDEVVIHPFDRIAGVDRDLGRREGEVVDLDLHDLARDPDVSACDLQQQNQGRATHCRFASGLLLYFRRACQMLGVLLVAFKDLEAGLRAGSSVRRSMPTG